MDRNLGKEGCLLAVIFAGKISAFFRAVKSVVTSPCLLDIHVHLVCDSSSEAFPLLGMKSTNGYFWSMYLFPQFQTWMIMCSMDVNSSSKQIRPES